MKFELHFLEIQTELRGFVNNIKQVPMIGKIDLLAEYYYIRMKSGDHKAFIILFSL